MVTIPSAATLLPDAVNSSYYVTGTTGISAIATVGRNIGDRIVLSFEGIVTLTYSTALNLAGGADTTTAAGDLLEFQASGNNSWDQIGRGTNTAPSSAVTSVNALTGAVVLTGSNIDVTDPYAGGTNATALNTAIADTAASASSAASAASAAQATANAALAQSANLSDVASASSSRSNLGLGGAAVLNVGTTSGTVAAGDDSRFTQDVTSVNTLTGAVVLDGSNIDVFDPVSSITQTLNNALDDVNSTVANKLTNSANLADVASPSAARANLGLGTSATMNVGYGGISGTVQQGGSISQNPALISAFFPASIAASMIGVYYVAAAAFSLPTDLAGTQMKAGTAATADTTFTIYKNGSSIGTLTISSGGSVTPSFTGTVTFSPGDVLSVSAPGTPDLTLANVGITFLGTFA